MFGGREQELAQLAKVWEKRYPGQTGHGGFDDYTLVDKINGAAFDGNQRAKGLAGDN